MNLYEMDIMVRAELLNALKTHLDFGPRRINELSNFLLDYVGQQLHSNNSSIRNFAQAQRWTALAYTRPDQATRELAKTLAALDQNNRIEQIRIVSLIETLDSLAEPLAALEEFAPLLTYARSVGQLARGSTESAKTQSHDSPRRSRKKNNIVGVEGIKDGVTKKISRVDIADITHALKIKKDTNQSMVLFWGSRAGGLFYNQSFYNTMKGYSTRNFNALSRQEQFAECYQVLQQDRLGDRDIHAILRASLREMATTEASICLAELVKQNFFDIIISTNVDTFLEDAFREIGMKEQHDFDVIIPKPASPLYDLFYSDKRPSCKVIKAFGDLHSREYNVARRDFYLDSILDLKGILEHILARDVLVIGFDSIWDAEMLRAFPVSKGSLWLVMEEDIRNKHPLASLAKHGRQVKCITGKIGSSEQFLKALHWQFYERMPMSYQIVHDMHSELRALRNKVDKLEIIQSDAQAAPMDNQPNDQPKESFLRKLRVFLCHASEDKPIVRLLFKKLEECDIDPWLDEKLLLGGQQWEEEITNILQEVDAIIVCISRNSTSKTGSVKKEIKMVLEAAEKQPEGTSFLIPLKLEKCNLPKQLRYLHAIDYYTENGFDQLIHTLQYVRDNNKIKGE